ncbi:MAG TPA: NADH-quinone oxidoreductase subunit C, partial [Candidatus Dormibacteraeota bacterium]|nr:NADH-quinone oxidoreductase subunit C [Candidatus Dormibacteraeota bacterium]
MSLSHEREDSLVTTLKENFPADIKDATVLRRSRVNITVAPEKIVEVAVFLRDKLGYEYPIGVSAVDYNRESRFEIVYHLSSIRNQDQKDIVVNLKESVPRNTPRATSLVKVWPGVENYERESLEMFGLQFDGHPHPEKLFLNDNW